MSAGFVSLPIEDGQIVCPCGERFPNTFDGMMLARSHVVDHPADDGAPS